MEKDKLFLDTCWITDVFGRRSGCAERFVEIMDALHEKYDLYITDGVYREAILDTSYPRDAALKKWLEGKRIEAISTNTPPGRDSGEISIIKTIENNTEFSNAKIASHDLNFFNAQKRKRGGHFYADRTVSLQNTLVSLVYEGLLSQKTYKDLSTKGSPNLAGGWKPANTLKISKKSKFMQNPAPNKSSASLPHRKKGWHR